MQAFQWFNRIFSRQNLHELYDEKIRAKTSVGIDRINRKAFESKLDDEIDIIHRKALNKTYEFSFYKEKLISKGRDKYPRVISIPTIRDKITLRAMTDLLSNVFQDELSNELIHTTVDAIKRDIASGEKNGFIKIDIKNFYPSLNHPVLLQKIKRKIRKIEILSLLEKAISQSTVAVAKKDIPKYQHTIGVPQGLSISNILAAIYMSDLDKKYKGYPDVSYYRYVDDILIICKFEDIEKIIDEMKADMAELHLTIHEPEKGSQKTDFGYLHEGFYFLGYYYRTFFSVREASIHKLQNSIIDLFAQYKYSRTKKIDILLWKLNLKITGCRIDEKKYGWVFFFSQIDDEKLLFKLDSFVQSMFHKFHVSRNNEVKRFVRTYYEIIKNRSNTKYIPNFDLFDIAAKKDILHRIYGEDVHGLPDAKIEYHFSRIIYQNIKEMEKDIQKY